MGVIGTIKGGQWKKEMYIRVVCHIKVGEGKSGVMSGAAARTGRFKEKRGKRINGIR